MKCSHVITVLFALAATCLAVPVAQVAETGSLQGIKWLDINGNGTQDDREPGLPGVVIYIDRNNNGGPEPGEHARITMVDDPGTTKNETGHYHFADVAPGDYVIREVVPDGFMQTFPATLFHSVVVASGQTVTNLDFGNRPLLTGTLHGTKWQDNNGNGRRDAGEPGLEGVVIYTDLNNNGVRDVGEPRAVTMRDLPGSSFDESGRYWLADLPPGEYTLREVHPQGFMQTFPPSLLHRVVLASGQMIEGLDFGNQPVLPGSLHGVKWQDDNANGQRDDNEPGLPGVVIYLDLNGNGVRNSDEPVAVSMRNDPVTRFDESGLYWFTSVVPGQYLIREVVPDGFVQTFPASGLHQADVTSGQTIESLDFGNQPLVPGSIHGVKWQDTNGNGRRDAREPGLAGVTIFSDLNHDGQLDRGEPRQITMRDIPETDFDEAGLYWFTKLAPGEYFVREVVPDGFVQTFPTAGFHPVLVVSGKTAEGIDFGNRPEPGDSDSDGIADSQDNCIHISNPSQRDTDTDGYGNFCDPDFNNDLTVDFFDLAYMKSVFFTADPDADLNGDSSVEFGDLAILKSMFFGPPGPSALMP